MGRKEQSATLTKLRTALFWTFIMDFRTGLLYYPCGAVSIRGLLPGYSFSGSFRPGNPRIFPVIPENKREGLQVKCRIEYKPRLRSLDRYEYAAALLRRKFRAFPDMPLHPGQQSGHKAIFQPCKLCHLARKLTYGRGFGGLALQGSTL